MVSVKKIRDTDLSVFHRRSALRSPSIGAGGRPGIHRGSTEDPPRIHRGSPAPDDGANRSADRRRSIGMLRRFPAFVGLPSGTPAAPPAPAARARSGSAISRRPLFGPVSLSRAAPAYGARGRLTKCTFCAIWRRQGYCGRGGAGRGSSRLARLVLGFCRPPACCGASRCFGWRLRGARRRLALGKSSLGRWVRRPSPPPAAKRRKTGILYNCFAFVQTLPAPQGAGGGGGAVWLPALSRGRGFSRGCGGSPLVGARCARLPRLRRGCCDCRSVLFGCCLRCCSFLPLRGFFSCHHGITAARFCQDLGSTPPPRSSGGEGLSASISAS